MDFTVENLCGLLMRSKLMTPDEVKTTYSRWQAEGRENVASSPHFARWMVTRNLLTEYQASLILKGHADDFFLNQYRILDRIGRGRMAGVYKAQHNLGQTVAIKVLPPSKTKNAQMLARFQREARLALKLKHPNVVRSFQMGDSKGLYYLVMEYLEGETLEEVLARRKKLPPQEAVRIVHQALIGLQHIADQGLVHRDLKPGNLMLTPAPGKGEPDNTLRATVKILDIGLGRELFDENATVDNKNPELTGEGVLLGTPDYLAPEQARDPRTIDVRADIYSLGCVLYHALAGQPPFPDKNLLNQMVRHATEPAKPLKDFNPAVSDGLQQVVNWMMAKKPDQRYPSPERAAQALQVFLVAEAAPVQRLEDVPQMKNYLTWLEGSEPRPASEESTVAPGAMMAEAIAKATQPKAKPTPTPPPPTRPRPETQGPSIQTPIPEIDVELVPMDMPAEKKGLIQKLGLSKREWILVGVIGVSFLVLLIVIVILATR